MSPYSKRTYALLALAGVLALVSLTTAIAVRSWPVAAVKPLIGPASIGAEELQSLAQRRLLIPVKGVDPRKLVDNFEEGRGTRKHEAIDILAPRGTPVVAVDDGRVARLFTSAAGGLTVYQFDREEKFIYYYAHLDRYADGLAPGGALKRGDVLGYVGTTGNAPKNTPHLHFTIFRTGPEKKWWKGTPVNPYPFLSDREPGAPHR
jgi:murein DD-endopeptidase MepM/ murein hydrolase activator NlpD